MTLPETRGMPTAEIMDSEEGAELGIQNIAMDDKEEKEKEKDEEKEKEQEKDEEKESENGNEKDKEKKDDMNGDVMSSRANLLDDSSVNTAF